MTVVETFNSFNVPVSIFASDLDTNVLATAAKGVYARDRVDRLSPERLNRFFVKSAGSDDGSFSVRPELRRLVTFQRLNLLEPSWSVRGPLDALFCRNVMIYFDKPTQYKILKRFAPLMDGKGLLFAPASGQAMSGSEDFSEFVDAGVPSLFFGIGGYDPATLAALKARGEPAPTNHSPFFAPSAEPAIRNAVAAIVLSIVGGVHPAPK